MNHFWNRFRSLPMLSDYLLIILGCIIGGAAYPLFLVPYSIAPGGLTGVAMILNHLTGLPIGTMSLCMNVPLFLMAFRIKGGVFFIRSVFATVLFSLVIDFLPFRPMEAEPLLGGLYGGILLGIGLGLIIKGGATTGGTDMIATLLHRHWPSLSVGTLLFIMDFIVVLTAGLAIGGRAALYAVVAIFLSSRSIDTVVGGFNGNKACFIISDQWESVGEKILRCMNRGVTYLTARGGYTGKERPMVLSVLSRSEIVRLKQIVREADPNAFLFITDAHEALGEGFAKLDEEN